jgi:hypothetical protein
LNAGPYNLSCILTGEDTSNLDDNFPDTQLFVVRMVDGHFADIVEFLNIGAAPSDMKIV